MKTLTTILLLATAFAAEAQTTITIKGKISHGSNLPLSGASVSLYAAKDSLFLSQTHTDSTGHYVLHSVSAPAMRLHIAAPGFAEDVQMLSPGQTLYEADAILMKDNLLSGVVVTGKKPAVEYKADRTVFNVENSIVAAGGNTLDALKKTPGVLVLHNQVTIAGKSGVSIMLNGRLQQVSGDDLIELLRSIPADNLNKIEVITTPPARYDAEGITGIINIITKKATKKGWKGSVTSSFQQNTYGSPFVSTMLQYRQGNLGLFCNANAGIYGWKYTNRTNSYYPDQRWYQTLDQGSVTNSARVQLGLDYALTPSSTFGIQYSESGSVMNNDEHIIARSYGSGEAMDSVIYTNGATKETSGGKRTLNLNYEWRIDSTGKKLVVDGDYFTQSSSKSRSFTVEDYLRDGTYTSGSDNRMSANPAITIRSVKADLELPMGKWNFTAGGKAAFVDNTSDNLFEVKTGGTYVTDPGRTNLFRYKEATQALYVSAERALGKVEIQAGLRGEHTRTQGYTPATGQTITNEYTQLFPTAYVQYHPGADHSINFNIARRINRPGYNMLNPFRFYLAPNSYVEGNPSLKPSYNVYMELGYRFKSSYSFRVMYNQTKDYWDRIIVTDTLSGSTALTRENLGRTRFFGVNFSANVNMYQWWQFTAGLSGSYPIFMPYPGYGAASYSRVNGSLEMDHTFFLDKKKNLAFEFNMYYNTPRQKDYKYWHEMYCFNFGFRKLLLDKNLVITLNFDDILASTYWYQKNLLNNANEYSYDDERAVRISITYKFGNSNVKGKKERSSGLEEVQRAN